MDSCYKRDIIYIRIGLTQTQGHNYTVTYLYKNQCIYVYMHIMGITVMKVKLNKI